MERIVRKKYTKEEIQDMQDVYDCILSSLHNVRRALSLNKHPLIKSLGMDIYDRLVAIEDIAKTSMKG